MAFGSNRETMINETVKNNLKPGINDYGTLNSETSEQDQSFEQVFTSKNDNSIRWKQIASAGVLLLILSACFTFQGKSSNFSKMYGKIIRTGLLEENSIANTPNIRSFKDREEFDSASDEKVSIDKKTFQTSKPFSTLSPYNTTTNENAKVFPFLRPEYSSPGPAFGPILSKGAHVSGRPVPTNAWYQNLLIGDNLNIKPTPHQQVYVIPYVIDFVGPIPGLRVNYPFSSGGDTVVQWTFNPGNALTLGKDPTKDGENDWAYSLLDYNVDNDLDPFSHLGFHLEWPQSQVTDEMTAPIVRGMPYATVIYGGNTLPVVASEIPISNPPLIDGSISLACDGKDVTAKVKSDVELYFKDSDFTWLVFYSRPVTVYCTSDEGAAFKLHVLPDNIHDEKLVVRTALVNSCTTGSDSIFCYRGMANNATSYADVLREHSDVYPEKPTLKYAIPKQANIQDEPQNVTLEFDWGVQAFNDDNNKDSLLFALPHHMDLFHESHVYVEYDVCVPTYHGSACLVSSNKWIMRDDLPHLGYTAPRPPKSDFIPALSDALHDDIEYELPAYFMRGAGDTYFSGKQLAKLGRILVILDELKQLQQAESIDDVKHLYSDVDENELEESILASKSVTLPSDDQFESALDRLRRGVQVWVNGTAETAFVYDLSWGGLVSCGCWFNGKNQACDNAYPNCPTFTDPGLDFGNGFYNDHHFHYGYHIYAAGVVARFDHQWGRDNFEDVLMLVRDIANPSSDDVFFPAFRHKDWYLGNSWASGIPTVGGQPYLNGRNQESSSEAIAAYEGVALFGSSMVDAWTSDETNPASMDNAATAAHVRDIGRLLTGTELRAADTYYHVRHDTESKKIYPPQYTPSVVGIMWSMMAQFQTWFGNSPFLAYGIQLLPLTSVSELRDNITWTKELYNDLAKSCESNDICMAQGWSILQYGVLAEVGHPELAMNMTLDLPDDVFTSAGGDGHSLSNTLWYVSSRPETKPIPIVQEKEFNCGCPKTCTKTAQFADAGGFTCVNRIKWLIDSAGQSEYDACTEIAVSEYPDQCGGCNPELCAVSPTAAPAPVSSNSTANEGPAVSKVSTCGCETTCTDVILNTDADGFTCGARIDWLVEDMKMEKLAACLQVGGVEYKDICGGCDPKRCVNVADIPTKSATAKKPDIDDGECGSCSPAVCDSDVNRCPHLTAPYLCYEGRNRGGCSPVPWTIGGICSKCCKVTEGCD